MFLWRVNLVILVTCYFTVCKGTIVATGESIGEITNGSYCSQRLVFSFNSEKITLENTNTSCDPSSYTVTLSRGNKALTVDNDCTFNLEAKDVKANTDVTISVSGENSLVFEIKPCLLGPIIYSVVGGVLFVIALALVIHVRCKRHNFSENSGLKVMYVMYWILGIIVIAMFSVLLAICLHLNWTLGLGIAMIINIGVQFFVDISMYCCSGCGKNKCKSNYTV